MTDWTAHEGFSFLPYQNFNDVSLKEYFMNLSDHINSKSMTVYQGQITNLVKWAKVLDPRPSGVQTFPDALWVICFYGHFIKCKRVKELAPVILKHRESLYQNLVLTYFIPKYSCVKYKCSVCFLGFWVCDAVLWTIIFLATWGQCNKLQTQHSLSSWYG